MDLRRVLAACTVPALFLVGCGSEDTVADSTPAGDTPTAQEPTDQEPADQEPTQAPEGDGLPGCEEIWVDGQTLPEDYAGCLEDGVEVPADGRYCEVGAELFTHADRFYAAAGARVNLVEGSLADSENYRTAVESCGG